MKAIRNAGITVDSVFPGLSNWFVPVPVAEAALALVLIATAGPWPVTGVAVSNGLALPSDIVRWGRGTRRAGDGREWRRRLPAACLMLSCS